MSGFSGYEAHLPPKVLEIIALIGLPATEKLVKSRGGTEIYVPTPERLSEDHFLVRLLGPEAARKLAERFGKGNRLKIPLGREAMRKARNAQIARRYYVDRVPRRDLAREFDLDERWIHEILNSTALADSRQTDLFTQEAGR